MGVYVVCVRVVSVCGVVFVFGVYMCIEWRVVCVVFVCVLIVCGWCVWIVCLCVWGL